MDAETKSRKLLTETDMLSIVESTEAELLYADKQLAATAAQIMDGTFSPGQFTDLVKRGCLTASTIQVNSVPAFVVVHAVNGLGWLIVEGAAHLATKTPASMGDLANGCYAIARHFGAPYIIFVTKLKSLYRYALEEQDFNSLGVILGRPVPCTTS
jgi:hypothetical protein